jgi:F5/8 type C domain
LRQISLALTLEGLASGKLAALLAGAFSACSFPDYSIEVDAGLGVARICSDGAPSEAETGIDCGGGCPPCQVDQPCKAATDCLTLSCVRGLCEPATCEDGTTNGSESDRDCGGQCERRCEVNRDCAAAADCVSGACETGTCQAPTCDDRVLNGDETDVDCGGACDACPTGARCTVRSDCVSDTCVNDTCVEPGCTDGNKNGGESDVDCGGADCSPCQPGETCRDAADCASASCGDDLLCADSHCDDGILNGDEASTDCGGATCAGCAELSPCMKHADCMSRVCQSDLCVPSAPTGQAIPSDSWAGKASSTFVDDSPFDVFDGNLETVWSTGKLQEPGMYFEVDLGELRAFYSINVVCPIEGDEAARFDVYAWRDREPTAPVRRDVVGFPDTTIRFATPQLARHVRLVLTQGKWAWWCIAELTVKK